MPGTSLKSSTRLRTKCHQGHRKDFVILDCFFSFIANPYSQYFSTLVTGILIHCVVVACSVSLGKQKCRKLRLPAGGPHKIQDLMLNSQGWNHCGICALWSWGSWQDWSISVELLNSNRILPCFKPQKIVELVIIGQFYQYLCGALFVIAECLFWVDQVSADHHNMYILPMTVMQNFKKVVSLLIYLFQYPWHTTTSCSSNIQQECSLHLQQTLLPYITYRNSSNSFPGRRNTFSLTAYPVPKSLGNMNAVGRAG